MQKKAQLIDIAIEKLKRGQYQPRRYFDQTLLEELAQSIRSAGLLQPVVVRPLSEATYEIIAGERRWRAAQLADLKTVPCLVRDYNDQQALEASTIENINRVDLNPIEEAKAYQRMIDCFHYTHEEIAAAVGKSRSKISNCLRLLKLADPVQNLLINQELSEGHGKILSSLNEGLQIKLAQQCQHKAWSVRQLEKAVNHAAQQVAANQTHDADIAALELALSDHMGSKTAIAYDKHGQGSLTINFQNLDVLEGLLEKMGYHTMEE